jgi:hypothetical protein
MGMIGGGRDAFMGSIHRLAANMDGLVELSCGAFGPKSRNRVLSAKDLFLPESIIEIAMIVNWKQHYHLTSN